MFGHNHPKQGFAIQAIGLILLLLSRPALAGALILGHTGAGTICYLTFVVTFLAGWLTAMGGYLSAFA